MSVHLVGGGLASLAAAALLIRDARVPGPDIHIYEADREMGGALRVAGDAGEGYVHPGGWLFEAGYRCTLDLLADIPLPGDPARSVADDIQLFSRYHGWDDRARLVGRRGRVLAYRLGLGADDAAALVRLMTATEATLSGRSVGDCVPAGLFNSGFWHAFASMAGFRPDHSAIELRRHLRRFLHLMPQLWSMRFVQPTRRNPQEAIVAPLVAWLARNGVRLHTQVRVEELTFAERGPLFHVTGLRTVDADGQEQWVPTAPRDRVFVILGSQAADTRLGTMAQAPARVSERESNAWTLWRRIAAARGPGMGRPGVFAARGAAATRVSFTVTDYGSAVPFRLEALTGQVAGLNGLITLRDSPWRLTVTRLHQPSVAGQPRNAVVWWGYGLRSEALGNRVRKAMPDCTGAEVLQEVLHQLGMDAAIDDALRHSICRPCLMPHAGSVLLTRRPGDRPPVAPRRARNLAFIGQFAELPDEAASTVEYSVRTAWTAVHRLMHTHRPPPPVALGVRRPWALLRRWDSELGCPARRAAPAPRRTWTYRGTHPGRGPVGR